MSIARLYHIETAASYDPQPGRFSVGGSLMDSYSGPINMGSSFRYVVFRRAAHLGRASPKEDVQFVMNG